MPPTAEPALTTVFSPASAAPNPPGAPRAPRGLSSPIPYPPPPAPPSNGTAPSAPAPDDQQTGFCSLHQAEMTQHTDPASGDTWYSHYLEDAQRYCKGVRPHRRNGRR